MFKRCLAAKLQELDPDKSHAEQVNETMKTAKLLFPTSLMGQVAELDNDVLVMQAVTVVGCMTVWGYVGGGMGHGL